MPMTQTIPVESVTLLVQPVPTSDHNTVLNVQTVLTYMKDIVSLNAQLVCMLMLLPEPAKPVPLHVLNVIKSVKPIYLLVTSSVQFVNILNISMSITTVLTIVPQDTITLKTQPDNAKFVKTHVNGVLMLTSVPNVDITT